MTFWDFCAPFYDLAEKANGKARNGMVRLINDALQPGAKVLELAAGTGFIGLAAAKKAESVTITDVSENMLRVARRKAKRRKLQNVSFQTCNIYDTGFADNAFDMVIAAQVLHLLDEPEKATAELRRIARNVVIVPVAMLENLSAGARFKLKLFRLLGFKPKRNFGAQSYREFLTGIGLPPDVFTIAEGAMPLAVAVWRKHA